MKKTVQLQNVAPYHDVIVRIKRGMIVKVSASGCARAELQGEVLMIPAKGGTVIFFPTTENASLHVVNRENCTQNIYVTSGPGREVLWQK